VGLFEFESITAMDVWI